MKVRIRKGKLKRDFRIANMVEAADPKWKVEQSKGGLTLRSNLIKGDLVLFYQDHPDELKNLSTEKLNERMYQLVKFDKSGRLYFRPHTEAKPASDLKERSIINVEQKWEQVVLTRNNWNFLVAEDGFIISRSGKVAFEF